jgi:hypothetical protein
MSAQPGKSQKRRKKKKVQKMKKSSIKYRVAYPRFKGKNSTITLDRLWQQTNTKNQSLIQNPALQAMKKRYFLTETLVFYPN